VGPEDDGTTRLLLKVVERRLDALAHPVRLRLVRTLTRISSWRHPPRRRRRARWLGVC